jgi:serine/threonine-protein kinase
VIFRALEKLKARRFQSAAQMREALQLAILPRSDCHSQGLAIPIVAKIHSPRILREELLQSRVEQIAIVEASPLPQYDRYFRRSIFIFLSDSQTLQSRSYAMGFSDRRDGKVLKATTIAEPIRELVGCFALTERSIYQLSEQTPQLLTRFHQSSRIAIDPKGRWMAVATLGSRNTTKILSVWTLSQPKLLQRPTICDATLGELIALVAVHSRYVVLVSQMQRSTRFDLFNRRGQAFGRLDIPIPLKQVFQTAQPYCLAATEVGRERSILIIHLKPYKLIRIAISICPKFVTAFTWGVVVASESEIIALDYTGQQLGRSEIPMGTCAIAAQGENGLAIATWHQGQSKLYTLDLEMIRSASL